MINRTLDDDFATYLLAVSGNRPRPLQGGNSQRALRMRAAEVEYAVLSFQLWLSALMADTAYNMSLSGDPLPLIDAALTDLASDLRGMMVAAIEEDIPTAPAQLRVCAS